MKNTKLFAAALLVAGTMASTAHAQTRTFVASDGNDANTASFCPRTAPCRTFAAAFSVTNTGGEVIAVDNAGFGAVNVTRSVTIDGNGGGLVAVTTGAAGITVNPGGTNLVILRNLKITGAGASSTTGILHTSGALVVQNVNLTLLTTGASIINARSSFTNTSFIGNGTGLRVSGTGNNTSDNPVTAAVAIARINGGDFLNNTTALLSVDPGTNKYNIYQWITSNTTAAFSTHFAGNGTFFTGTGVGCPCYGINYYSSSTNP
jgi:hypothetical protein